MFIGNFDILDLLINVIDILLVTIILYKLIMVIRGTRAVQLLKGIFVILVVWFISDKFQLQTLNWMMQQVLIWGVIAFVIIFQPELRRALEQLGRGRFFSRTSTQDDEDVEKQIEAIISATDYMAKRRIGALMSLERETGMNDYIETGIPLYANISKELLINIFIPNTPLHDGAVIIQKNKVAAAACYLPLSESPFISKELGTRHRAAVGISEVSDSLTIVVSEETGSISLTRNGELHRDIKLDKLKEMLTAELMADVKTKQNSSSWWNWRVKSNG